MSLRLAIVGATGLVGRQMLRIMEGEGAELAALGLFASPSSAGERISVLGRDYTVQSLADADFRDYDAAFFCVGDALSKEYVPKALAAGCAVVDKSGVYRLDPQVPLVVPGVNDSAITPSTRLVANPNCTTIVMLHALAPLAREFGLRQLFAATYQSVSGAGKEAVEQLANRSAAALSGGSLDASSLDPAEYAFNVVPQIGGLDEQGRCGEEAKLIEESRKILGQPGLTVVAHSVRVPVSAGHGIAVTAQFERPATAQQIEALWSASTNLNFSPAGLPTPLSCSKHDRVEVGRLRPEPQLGAGTAWSFFCCGDNINIGAALNGWRIFRLLEKAGALRETASVA